MLPPSAGPGPGPRPHHVPELLPSPQPALALRDGGQQVLQRAAAPPQTTAQGAQPTAVQPAAAAATAAPAVTRARGTSTSTPAFQQSAQAPASSSDSFARGSAVFPARSKRWQLSTLRCSYCYTNGGTSARMRLPNAPPPPEPTCPGRPARCHRPPIRGPGCCPRRWCLWCRPWRATRADPWVHLRRPGRPGPGRCRSRPV